MSSFNIALKSLDDNMLIRRKSWENGMFIFKQVPSQISKDIVPKMTSLPLLVKMEFQKRFEENENLKGIEYDFQIALVNKDNLIVGYSPSNEDILSDDWEIVE